MRGDLERLADELLGLNTRPERYIGNRDMTAPNFAGDVRLDLELLADDRLGVGNRPPGWIGGTSNSPATSYLNLRHDLELLADVTLGINKRPTGWQGVNPIERCEPLVRSLAFLDQQAFTDFTRQRHRPERARLLRAGQPSRSTRWSKIRRSLTWSPRKQMMTASSNYAFSYLDVAATQYMGVMPAGTQFRALYRNYGDSNMMFVQGDNFALYVDMRFTSLSRRPSAACRRWRRTIRSRSAMRSGATVPDRRPRRPDQVRCFGAGADDASRDAERRRNRRQQAACLVELRCA